MEEEIWYDVPNYEGYYQCSNALRFRSLERTMIKSDGHKRIDKSRLMTITLAKNKKQYPKITFHKNGKQKGFNVHVIIADIFIPNPFNYKCINHKNGNKNDYSLNNLERCTYSHNNKHAYDIGLNKRIVGEASHRYGKRGELSNTFGAKNWSVREVIDLNTNKIYDCIKNASIELGLPYALTRQRLNRNRLWLTNLRYV